MVICPICGKVNPDGARNCDVCGAPLMNAERVQTAQQATASPANGSEPFSGPLCPVCRRPNRSASVFCAHCGHRLKQNGQSSGDHSFALPHMGAAPPSAVASTDKFPPTVAADVTGNIPTGTVLKKHYRVLRKVAQGGMGAVYESTDLSGAQGNRWAIKEISPAALPPGERAQAVADFRREAQMLASLRHPNLVSVLESFEELGKHFLVMEFVPGRTLLNVLDAASDSLPEDRVMAWARQLTDVIQYLHSQDSPVIYRDLKPANIMLVEGTERIKLIDFGIARLHKAGKSQDTEAFGTAGYAPPEQYGKGQTDQRSDIYALAATLHQLLTNRDPSLNPFNWLPVRQYNPKVSQTVASAIGEALNLDPQRRFQTIEAFARAMGISLPTRAGAKQAGQPDPQPVATQRAAKPLTAAPVQTPAPATPKVKSNGQVKRKTQPQPSAPVSSPAPSEESIFGSLAPAQSLPGKPSTTQYNSTASKALQDELKAIEQKIGAPAEAPPQAASKSSNGASSSASPAFPDVVAPTTSTGAPPVSKPKDVQGPASKRGPVEVKIPAPESSSVLVLSERMVDLGESNWNRKPMRRVQVSSAGGESVAGMVVASQPWIAYNPSRFRGTNVTLEVKVRGRRLRFGQVELQVPNLFAIIWARTRRVLPFIGCWFWLVLLVATSLGKTLLYGLVGTLGLVLAAEALMWLWSVHVRLLVPAERLNTGRLWVKSTGGDQQIEVRVMARPSQVRRAAGWTMALLLLTAELACVAWLALTVAGIQLSEFIPAL